MLTHNPPELPTALSQVSRQDMSGSIPVNESEEFLKTVKKLAEEVCPTGDLLIHDTGLDIEILPRLSQESQAESATFHKGKGLEFLDDRLKLDVSKGPNLVCGDTSSDVPMVETAMALCPERTWAIFITKDKQLIGRVTAICPRTLILPSPDCLVSTLYRFLHSNTALSLTRPPHLSSTLVRELLEGKGLQRGCTGAVRKGLLAQQ